MKVAVSILNCPYKEDEIISKINTTNADYLHVDVNDGEFANVVKTEYKFLHMSNKPLNVHLMVNNPLSYITFFKSVNAHEVIFQVELDSDIDSILDNIKSHGMRCGLALKPSTSVMEIEKYLSKLDSVLIMSTIPGKSGQTMMESTLYKIDILAKMRKEGNYNYNIIIDGGINDTTISKVKGVDIVVSGSFIWKSDDLQAQIDKLRL